MSEDNSRVFEREPVSEKITVLYGDRTIPGIIVNRSVQGILVKPDSDDGCFTREGVGDELVYFYSGEESQVSSIKWKARIVRVDESPDAVVVALENL